MNLHDYHKNNNHIFSFKPQHSITKEEVMKITVAQIDGLFNAGLISDDEKTVSAENGSLANEILSRLVDKALEVKPAPATNSAKDEPDGGAIDELKNVMDQITKLTAKISDFEANLQSLTQKPEPSALDVANKLWLKNEGGK